MEGLDELGREVGIKEALRGAKKELVDLVVRSTAITNKIFKIFSGVEQRRLPALCDRLLHVARGTRSDLTDVILCPLTYEAVIDFASGNAGTPLNLLQRQFYTLYLDPSIRRAWQLVVDSETIESEASQTPNGNADHIRTHRGEMSVSAGMELLGMVGYRKMRFPYTCPYPTFGMLMGQMKELYRFLISRAGNPHFTDQGVNPKLESVKAFLQSQQRNVTPESNSATSEAFSTDEASSDGTVENHSGVDGPENGTESPAPCPESTGVDANPGGEQPILPSSRRSARLRSSNDESEDATSSVSPAYSMIEDVPVVGVQVGQEEHALSESPDERSAADRSARPNSPRDSLAAPIESMTSCFPDGSPIPTNYAQSKDWGPVARSRNFEQLRVHLKSFAVNDDGDVIMNRADWTKFINSPLVTSLVFARLMW